MSAYDGDERCEWPSCPGYEEDPEHPMQHREDGDWHDECLDAYFNEQARFFRRQMDQPFAEPIHAIVAVDEFIDDLMARGDIERKGEP